MDKNQTKERKSLSIRNVGWTLGGFGIAIVAMLIISLYMLSYQFKNVKKTTEDYVNLKLSAMDVQSASDYLTDQARSFVVTGEDEYIFNYIKESFETKRRETALETLKGELGDIKAYQDLNKAVDSSVALMDTEYYAMHLTIQAFGSDYNPDNYSTPEKKSYCEKIAQYVLSVELLPEDAALSSGEQKQKAIEYVYGNEYQKQKRDISGAIVSSISEIDTLLEKNVISSSDQLNRVLFVQQIFIVLLVVFFVAAVIFIRQGLLKPINYAINKISHREFLDGSRGLREYKYLVSAYNEARSISINNAEKLTYIAEHDKLTGVYNRTGYDRIYRDLHLEKTIFILVDLDDFKAINDNYGHNVGDKLLKTISAILSKFFPNDFVCRIGGDEFAILIFDYKDGIREDLIRKFVAIEKEIATKKDDLPSESISIGIAFGTNEDDTDSLYRKADKAMYHIKTRTKSGYCFYDNIKESK